MATPPSSSSSSSLLSLLSSPRPQKSHVPHAAGMTTTMGVAMPLPRHLPSATASLPSLPPRTNSISSREEIAPTPPLVLKQKEQNEKMERVRKRNEMLGFISLSPAPSPRTSPEPKSPDQIEESVMMTLESVLPTSSTSTSASNSLVNSPASSVTRHVMLGGATTTTTTTTTSSRNDGNRDEQDEEEVGRLGLNDGIVGGAPSSLGVSIKSGTMTPRRKKMATKTFKDQVYGQIELPSLLVAIMDTPQFQRLRNLKQLGCAYFVYPGASHNRFEHSIGVAHLAGQLLKHLRDSQPELNITDVDVLAIQVAALCHDLGHGPYSHTFDNSFIPRALGAMGRTSNYCHELMSFEILTYLLRDNNISIADYGLREDPDLVFIKECILGDKIPGGIARRRGRRIEKSFLYDVVNNVHDGLDVDKWDYYERDARNTGVHNGCDVQRLIAESRVESYENVSATKWSGSLSVVSNSMPREELQRQTSGNNKSGVQVYNGPSLNDTHYDHHDVRSGESGGEDSSQHDAEEEDDDEEDDDDDDERARKRTRLALTKEARVLQQHNDRLLAALERATWRIVFPDKLLPDVLTAFQTRFRLHHSVYQHKVVKAIELMLVDALLLADAAGIFSFPGAGGAELSLRESIRDPVAFCLAQDDVMQQIRMSRLSTPRALAAKALIRRIDKRELYVSVGEVSISRPPNGSSSSSSLFRPAAAATPAAFGSHNREDLNDNNNNNNNNNNKSFSKETLSQIETRRGGDLSSLYDSGAESIKEMLLRTSVARKAGLGFADVIVELVRISHGTEYANPVNNVYFYSKRNPKRARRIPESKYENLCPRTFIKEAVRVFCTSTDANKIVAVHDSFVELTSQFQPLLRASGGGGGVIGGGVLTASAVSAARPYLSTTATPLTFAESEE